MEKIKRYEYSNIVAKKLLENIENENEQKNQSRRNLNRLNSFSSKYPSPFKSYFAIDCSV